MLGELRENLGQGGVQLRLRMNLGNRKLLAQLARELPIVVP